MKWEEYSKSIYDVCKERRVPFHASFELTPFCNFACNMCYVRLTKAQAAMQGDLLSAEKWLSIAENARKMGVTLLEITGGEPTIRPDFPQLYKAFSKMGFIITLRTNGYRLDGELLELLYHYKPRRISITLYGGSDETYQKVCGVSNGFTVVTSNILSMLELDMPPRLTMTVTRDNQKDFYLIHDWAEKHGLKVTAFSGLFNPIRGAKRNIDELRADYSTTKVSSDVDVIGSGNRTVLNRERYLSPFWMCRGYGATFSISWDGYMRLCNAMVAVCKDVVTANLDDAYRDLYSDLDRIKRPRRCMKCSIIDYCDACPKWLYSATGHPDETNDDVCRMALERYIRHMDKIKN